MEQYSLVSGETVTSAQLTRWRREFGGVCIDPNGCLLVSADTEGDRWYLLNAYGGFQEIGPWPCASYTDMPDGLGGCVGRGASVRAFLAAARRLTAQREARDEHRARECADIKAAFAQEHRIERIRASAFNRDTC